MRSQLMNGGAFSRTAFQAIAKTATAAGSGDNTEVDGEWVGRKVAEGENGQLAMSAKLTIVYEAVLAAEETLSFKANFQDAADIAGAGVADYGDLIPITVVATGPSGGATIKGTVEIDVDLAGAREFVRSQITPDLSASGTDTLKWSAILSFFGDNRQPSTKAIASVGGA